MDLGRIVIRGVVGPLFIGHGTQKLFGWFEGAGLEGTGGFFEKLGLRPGKQHAAAAGIAETGGGVLLLLGAMAAIAERGPGTPSVDEKLFPKLKGTKWAIAQLAAGAAGSYAATRISPSPPSEADEPTGGNGRPARFEREPSEAPA
jgi:putative oxidoreductase